MSKSPPRKGSNAGRSARAGVGPTTPGAGPPPNALERGEVSGAAAGSASAALEAPRAGTRGFVWTLVLLGGLLALLFSSVFQANQVLFANDGPLAANAAACRAFPAGFRGIWQDLNWLGGSGGSGFPDLTYLCLWLLQPVGFAKFYTPITLLTLGLSAWLFFRRSGFRPAVCLLGSLAAMLNSDFFSYACWGLGTLPLAVAAWFLTLAALISGPRVGWGRATILGGLALGMAIMEGFDNGAIFSIYVAAYVMYQAWGERGSSTRRLAWGAVRTAVIAVCAAVLAAQVLTTLIGTQIKGVVGMEEPQKSSRERWDFATQWSLPKVETLGILVPGLFGYRMDTPDGGNYWGAVGQTPGWETHHQGIPRHSGAGFYGGILVLLLAAWAIAQALRKTDSPFTPGERRTIRFWAWAALISLLFSFGRYAPFYQFVFALPYFSTIRNPIKFLHPLSVALVVLFGYGLQGLFRLGLEAPAEKLASLRAHWKSWWATARPADRRWTRLALGWVIASMVGGLIYAGSSSEMSHYLQGVGFQQELADTIFHASLAAVGWYLLFLIVAVGLVALVQCRAFAGPRAKWALLLLGVVLVFDLMRADAPWVVHYDYKEKLATNPLFDLLRDRPYLRRVAVPNFEMPPQLAFFPNIVNEWEQHQFQYYNVQALEFTQLPRVPRDYAAFNKAVGSQAVRLFELTNTRYLLSLAGYLDVINSTWDPQLRRFHVHTWFTLTNTLSGEITVVTNTTGPFALIEYAGALPRASLYSHWQVTTNDAETLTNLASPAFDPARTVLVDQPTPAPPSLLPTNATPVEFLHYTPKDILLSTRSDRPGVLLLIDRFDPDWHVSVDGQPAPLLRCNFVNRGVFLTAGPHQVEFRYEPSIAMFYVSLGAVLGGLALAGWVGLSSGKPAA